MNINSSQSSGTIPVETKNNNDMPPRPTPGIPITIRNTNITHPIITVTHCNEHTTDNTQTIAKQLDTVHQVSDQKRGGNNLRPSQQYNIYLHTTAEENLAAIHKEGLVAGGTHLAKKGIGNENGKMCNDGIYVVMPGQSIADARSEAVAIISKQEPFPDLSYAPGVAGVFTEPTIRPIREAANKPESSPHTPPNRETTIFSFLVDQITPSTQAGIAATLDKSPHSAEKLALDSFKKNYPAYNTSFLALPTLKEDDSISIESLDPSLELDQQTDESSLLWSLESTSSPKK